MPRDHTKVLINLLESFTHKQLFFMAWFVIVATFVMLMISFYRKNNRSHFRSRTEGPGPKIRVDSRRLGGERSGGKEVVQKDNSPARK